LESIETISVDPPDEKVPKATSSAGPPFVWKFVPMIVTSHPAAALLLGVTAVTVGIAA
jgi:hypothetical protein